MVKCNECDNENMGDCWNIVDDEIVCFECQEKEKKVVKFKIVFDTGKPYEKEVRTEQELRKELTDFYQQNKDSDNYFDVKIYDKNDIDITESQIINEMVSEIIEV